MLVDPDGKDDCFLKNGKYSHSTGSGSNIYINNTLLSEYNLESIENQMAFVQVVAHYARKVGISSGKVGFKKGNNALAEGQNIYINNQEGKNKISSLLYDIANMKSTLVHEEIHKKRGHSYRMNNYQYAQVYLEQIRNSEFSNTTAEYKSVAIKTFAEEMEAAINKGQGTLDDLNKLFNDGNKAVGTYGYRFNIRHTMIDGKSETRIDVIKKE